MGRAIGISQFMDKNFITYPFDGKWLESFGEPEKNFKMIVYGHSGNGKTEFCIQLAKYMASFTKVYYNSFEQGISKSLQDALHRNNMREVTGKVMFGDKESVQEMDARLSNRNAPQVCFIDSRDYINLTTQQFKWLIERHKRKCFIIICWEKSGLPKGEYAKDIEFMCDIKVRVSQFKAYIRGRFGGNKTYTIWNRNAKAGDQLELKIAGNE